MENRASARVLEKLGFRREAVVADRWFWKGEFHDLWLYALSRDDWSPPEG